MCHVLLFIFPSIVCFPTLFLCPPVSCLQLVLVYSLCAPSCLYQFILCYSPGFFSCVHCLFFQSPSGMLSGFCFSLHSFIFLFLFWFSGPKFVVVFVVINLVSSESPLTTHCTLLAQYQTADIQLAGEDSGAFSS